jgi:hypothetical protein
VQPAQFDEISATVYFASERTDRFDFKSLLRRVSRLGKPAV